MKSLSIILGLAFSITSVANATASTEPAYCNPTTFYSKETKVNNSELERAHLYLLGKTKVLGMAVGNSDATETANFAQTQSSARATDKFCTWYFNKGNKKAEAWFTHRYVSNPSGLTTVTGPQKYNETLKDEFANAIPSFLSCAKQHKYIAMGCDGQKHRGPTVFGMMLAYSGCSPQNAATIVNKVWGLNGVKAEVRLAIITEGKKLGDADPEARRQMQAAFGVAE